ncbi:DUF2290 domain-containing protein [Mesorhizobium soli]
MANLESLSREACLRARKLSLTSKDYTEIYDRGLSLSHYNFLLTDYSYFQFSYASDTEYALAYYPNPRLSGSPEATELFRELEKERDGGSLNDEEFSELVAEFPSQGFIPRVRFEYSGNQYRNVRHPGAHFHLGMSGEDRWPSARKLSPRSFTLLMAKFYYPATWWQGSRFSRPDGEQHLQLADCLDEKLLSSIRLDGASQFFSDDEKMGFHFAALHGPAT